MFWVSFCKALLQKNNSKKFVTTKWPPKKKIKHQYWVLQELQRHQLQNKTLLHPWQWVVLATSCLAAKHEHFTAKFQKPTLLLEYILLSPLRVVDRDELEDYKLKPKFRRVTISVWNSFPTWECFHAFNQSCGQIFCPETLIIGSLRDYIEIVTFHFIGKTPTKKASRNSSSMQHQTTFSQAYQTNGKAARFPLSWKFEAVTRCEEFGWSPICSFVC